MEFIIGQCEYNYVCVIFSGLQCQFFISGKFLIPNMNSEKGYKFQTFILHIFKITIDWFLTLNAF